MIFLLGGIRGERKGKFGESYVRILGGGGKKGKMSEGMNGGMGRINRTDREYSVLYSLCKAIVITQRFAEI